MVIADLEAGSELSQSKPVVSSISPLSLGCAGRDRDLPDNLDVHAMRLGLGKVTDVQSLAIEDNARARRGGQCTARDVSSQMIEHRTSK